MKNKKESTPKKSINFLLLVFCQQFAVALVISNYVTIGYSYIKLSFVSHCLRSPQSAPQPIADLLFLKPKGRKKKGNRKHLNFSKIFYTETNSISLEKLQYYNIKC